MVKPTVSDYVSRLHSDLVPEVSKGRYDKAWNNFEDWLKQRDQQVTEDSLMAYAVYLQEEGYAPTTLRTVTSMLEKNAWALENQ